MVLPNVSNYITRSYIDTFFNNCPYISGVLGTSENYLGDDATGYKVPLTTETTLGSVVGLNSTIFYSAPASGVWTASYQKTVNNLRVIVPGYSKGNCLALASMGHSFLLVSRILDIDYSLTGKNKIDALMSGSIKSKSINGREIKAIQVSDKSLDSRNRVTFVNHECVANSLVQAVKDKNGLLSPAIDDLTNHFVFLSKKNNDNICSNATSESFSSQ